MIDTEDVEICIQNPLQAAEVRSNPWDGHGRAGVDDFIAVIRGEWANREGFVKEVVESSFVVQEIRQEVGQPLAIVAGSHIDAEIQGVSLHIYIPLTPG